jgi:hypothetical protein
MNRPKGRGINHNKDYALNKYFYRYLITAIEKSKKLFVFLWTNLLRRH